MIHRIGLSILALCVAASVTARQRIEIPTLKKEYPRMVDDSACRQSIVQLLATPAGKTAMEGLRNRVEPYAERHTSDPDWLVDRLQMYWQSHATEIYIDGEVLDHVAGRAPVPTVRYTASRGTQTDYARPALGHSSGGGRATSAMPKWPPMSSTPT